MRLLLIRQHRARRIDDRPAGAHHDLGPLFDRLNGTYFEHALARPSLGWSTRAWRTQLGCFDPALDQIVINRQLDHTRVPEYVVGYVLYHEMLHVKHPTRRSGCSLISHSPEFRAEEKQFPEFDKARKILDRLAS